MQGLANATLSINCHCLRFNANKVTTCYEYQRALQSPNEKSHTLLDFLPDSTTGQHHGTVLRDSHVYTNKNCPVRVLQFLGIANTFTLLRST